MDRKRLADRRLCESFPISVPGMRQKIVVSVGRFDDGRLAEVFVSDVKSGSTTDALMRDAAVILSIALQYGLPSRALEAIVKAITRERDGTASSPIGGLMETLAKGESGE